MILKRTLIHVAILSCSMGFFSDVGRKFEETKQSLIDSKQAEYVCASCENPVNENSEYCPHCGKDSVEPAT
jgi:rubrerythrin